MVNKTTVLIRSFLKKSLAQIIALIILFIFSSLLLNVFVYVQTDYSNNYDRYCEQLNTEDLSFIYNNLVDINLKDDVSKTISSIDYVEDYEIDDVITGPGSIEFNGGEIDNVISICSYDDIGKKKISKYEILNDVDSEGVILSYLFDVSGEYKVGDIISFRVKENSYEYPIVGFYNATTTGTINCPDITIIATDKIFDEIKSSTNFGMKISANIEEGRDYEDAFNSISSKIGENYPSLVLLDGNNKDCIHDNRYSNAQLFEVVLSAGSIIMVAVQLIIIFITLNNYIKNSTRDLGALKAIGYTSKNIIVPIVLALTFISFVASIIGSLSSYYVLPLINDALESQIGIPYIIKFRLLPFIISVLVVCFMTFITTLISVFKIKKIAPINAIRENKAQANKSSKIITLDKSNININTLIGLKGFFSGVGRNVVILVAITAVSFLAGFTCFMYQNVIKDNRGVIELVCGQIADSTLTVYAENEERLVDELKNNNDVDDYYLYSIVTITPKDHQVFNAYIYDDSSYLNKKSILLEGNLPENENEIAINKAYAKHNDIELGDEMIFTENNQDCRVTVTGFTQGAYYSGRDCYMLRDTYNKIKDLYATSYYVSLKDGVDIDAFNNEMKEKLPNTIINYVNQDKYLQSTAALYSSILNVLAVVISILSLLIIIFVLYILIYILLKNKRREHGILKSIGYTSSEIIYQTIITILPTCSVAIIIGLLLSKDGVKDLLSTALNSIGIFRFGSSTNSLYLILAGAFLILFTIIYTLVLSLPIKKISPHDLFNNE